MSDDITVGGLRDVLQRMQTAMSATTVAITVGGIRVGVIGYMNRHRHLIPDSGPLDFGGPTDGQGSITGTPDALRALRSWLVDSVLDALLNWHPYDATDLAATIRAIDEALRGGGADA